MDGAARCLAVGGGSDGSYGRYEGDGFWLGDGDADLSDGWDTSDESGISGTMQILTGRIDALKSL